MKSKQSESWPGGMSAMSFEGLGEVGEVVSQAADRTRAVVNAGVKALQTESTKFLDDFSSQSEVALEQMARCKSPFEMMAVQQGWLQARSLAYLQSGLRVAKTLATVSAVKASTGERPRHAASAQPHNGGGSRASSAI